MGSSRGRNVSLFMITIVTCTGGDAYYLPRLWQIEVALSMLEKVLDYLL